MSARDRKEERENSILSVAQERAALLIASGRRGREVAESLGVSEHVVSRWRQTPEFKAAVNLRQKQARQEAIDSLVELSTGAVDAIAAVLKDPEASASDRLKAATIVLDRLGIDNIAIGPVDSAEIAARDRADERRRNLLNGI